MSVKRVNIIKWKVIVGNIIKGRFGMEKVIGLRELGEYNKGSVIKWNVVR